MFCAFAAGMPILNIGVSAAEAPQKPNVIYIMADDLDKKVYSHDLIIGKALEFIEKNADKPFFSMFTHLTVMERSGDISAISMKVTFTLRLSYNGPKKSNQEVEII